jgi:hypothetical protein
MVFYFNSKATKSCFSKSTLSFTIVHNKKIVIFYLTLVKQIYNTRRKQETQEVERGPKKKP